MCLPPSNIVNVWSLRSLHLRIHSRRHLIHHLRLLKKGLLKSRGLLFSLSQLVSFLRDCAADAWETWPCLLNNFVCSMSASFNATCHSVVLVSEEHVERGEEQENELEDKCQQWQLGVCWHKRNLGDSACDQWSNIDQNLQLSQIELYRESPQEPRKFNKHWLHSNRHEVCHEEEKVEEHLEVHDISHFISLISVAFLWHRRIEPVEDGPDRIQSTHIYLY